MSIVHRKRTALSIAEWIMILRTRIQKTERDVMFDVMSDISGILEDFHCARAFEDSVKREEQYLLVVEEYWRTDVSWCFDNISPSKEIGDLIRRNFVDLIGEDVAIAYIMSHYWIACLLLYSTLCLALAAYSAVESFFACLCGQTHARIAKTSSTRLRCFIIPWPGEFGARLKRLPYSVFKSAVVPQATEGADYSRVEQMAASERAWFGMEQEESLEAVVSSFRTPTTEWNYA
ncbi:hypothetical protein FDECE_4474 [Fusarium decemcellulare]|nr:hypothetical protein FDECE_4474 [Fusarium decemcellulare]